MRTLFRMVPVVLVLALALPASADEKNDEKKPTEKQVEEKKPDEKKPTDEKKPDEKKPEEKKPEEKKPDEKKPADAKTPDKKPVARKPEPKKPADDPWIVETKVSGVVVNGEGSKGLALKVKMPEINPGAVQNIQNWQFQLATTNDPDQRRNLMFQIANQQRNMYNYRDVDVSIAPTEDVVVRIMYPPEQFDDKGRPKKYTAKELKELKGPDTKQPGYPADMDSIQPGQLVTVQLVRKKGGPKPKANMKPEEIAAFVAENPPTTNKIIIERPPAPTPPGQ